MEHVADPVAFTRAAAHALKPGGVFMAITLNQWHYFGLTTWATSSSVSTSGCCDGCATPG